MMRSITRVFSSNSKSKNNIIVDGMKDFRPLIKSDSYTDCENLEEYWKYLSKG